jgi:hypothetical protein
MTAAAIPAAIMTRGGVVTAGDWGSLAERRLSAADMPATTGMANKLTTGWRRTRIMECQSDAITERAALRQHARTAGAGGSATTTGSSARRQVGQSQVAAGHRRGVRGHPVAGRRARGACDTKR